LFIWFRGKVYGDIVYDGRKVVKYWVIARRGILNWKKRQRRCNKSGKSNVIEKRVEFSERVE